MFNINLIPDDTLFIKDARPIGSGSFYGRGGNLPLGPAVHGALRTAILSGWIENQPNCLPISKMIQGRTRKYGSAELRDLYLCGPFLANDSDMFLPTPLDLYIDGATVKQMSWMNKDFKNSLPNWVTGVFIGKPSKSKPHMWIPSALLEGYIKGDLECAAKELKENSDFYITEHREGINLKTKDLFGVEHMRFNTASYLTCFVRTKDQHKLESLKSVQLGGESRICKVTLGNRVPLPRPYISGKFVKWCLLSPAVFVGQNGKAEQGAGWVPDFVDPKTGKVLLTTVKDRHNIEGFRRLTKQNDSNVLIDAELVSAVTGIPRPISHWDKIEGKVKSDYLAVPEGSVYYFKCANNDHANRLVDALHFKTRSSYLGEKGLGLGICAPWNM